MFPAYRTGRKIKKIYSKEFTHFYHLLHNLEKDSGLKLKLGPLDFGIHSTLAVSPPLKVGEHVEVQILDFGRWNDEYIAIYTPDWAIKILSKEKYKIGQIIKVEIIKGNLSGNLLTGRSY